jgi:anti-sigma factor RsiW
MNIVPEPPAVRSLARWLLGNSHDADDAIPRRVSRLMWTALAASMVVIVVGTAVATSVFQHLVDGELLDGEFIDNHVRAIRASKPVDVASTNRSALTSWFDNKSRLVPEVVDTSAQGFPLVGGRIDVIRGSVAPAVVYTRGPQLIDVWMLSPGLGPKVHNDIRTFNGYNMVPFTMHGTHYIVASNLATDELVAFVKLLQEAP